MCCNQAPIHVLVAEDDGDINALVVQALSDAGGFTPVAAYSGTEALLRLKQESFDIALLDLSLPGMKGDAVLQEIRRSDQSGVPVIIVTAVYDKATKLALLNAGADDYLTKPFDVDELISRVHAVLRRTYKNVNNDVLAYKSLRLDAAAREASLAGVPITLTAREFDILLTLLRHPKKVFSRMNLYESVWNESYLGDESTVNVHVSNLRGKLAAAQGAEKEEYIKTVWGIGFRMAE